jgi:2-C-methyl-D-erythritol 4-phosphate cytidylyltransferase
MTTGVAALVAAAGSGDRLGRGPKALVEVGGRSLLAWALSGLAAEVDEVLVAVPGDLVARLAHEYPHVRVIAGGATRQATVAALARATAREVVVVHDAARPFVDAPTVRACVAAARRDGAASVVTSVADTLVDVDTGAAVDRDRLRAVQTPQAFRRAWLLEAHEAAEVAGRSATDDAGLVRLLGRPVSLVPGGSHLFKVTTATDLALADAYARALTAVGTSGGGR